MSFPQRHPMGMMPGGVPFAFTPMGMMPMGMVPMMRPGMPPMSAPQIMTSQPQMPVKPTVPTPKPPETKKEKPPVTTVFVGNISDKAPDSMIRQMLQKCGTVLSWKRVQGASGKLQAFGFCEYEHPESTLRCIRLLNEWQIADKKLLVKVDAKTKNLLEEHNKKKKESDAESNKEEEDADEVMQKQDKTAQDGLDAIMKEYEGELTRATIAEAAAAAKAPHPIPQPLPTPARPPAPVPQKLDRMQVDFDKKDLISNEIRNFRDSYRVIMHYFSSSNT